MAQFSHIKSTIRESFRMAIEAIRQNKLRSILTLLGISIGVFSVIGVMTAIRTLESSVNSQLDVLGTNNRCIWFSIEVQLMMCSFSLRIIKLRFYFNLFHTD